MDETARELQARLKDAFVYDPETGVFLHRKDGMHKKAMTPACSLNKSLGYQTIRWDGRNAYAHRMAWVYVHGEHPNRVDHINGNRADNRLANLRSVTQSENLQNQSSKPKGGNKLLGASLDKRTGRYFAYIGHKGKTKHLGRFATAEEAHQAHLSAKMVLHTANPIHREATQ